MITIEPFKIEYLDQLYSVETDSFSIPWSKSDIEKDATQNKMSIYLVALEDNQVIGYAAMWHVVNEGHITNIAVSPNHRQKGIGTLLVNALINIAKEKEMIGLTLEVNINNTNAQKLYTKLGFKPEGIRKEYYKDTKEDAVIMWKYLN